MFQPLRKPLVDGRPLNGGEDYELLFTVPLEKHDIAAAIPEVRVIGHITKPELGCCMITRDDTEITLRAQGWKDVYKRQICSWA